MGVQYEDGSELESEPRQNESEGGQRVLRLVVGYSADEIAQLRAAGDLVDAAYNSTSVDGE
jgi:hypothetical protein